MDERDYRDQNQSNGWGYGQSESEVPPQQDGDEYHDRQPADNEPDYYSGMTTSGSGEAEVDYSVAKGASVTVNPQAGYRDYEEETYGTTREDNAGDGYSYYSDGYDGYTESPDPSGESYSYGRSNTYEDEPAGSYRSSRQPYEHYYTGTRGTAARRKPEKKSSGGFRRFIASVLLVALCGAAGFGGAALANHKAASNSHAKTSNVNIVGDVTSVNAASAIAEKVMPSVVGISTVSQAQRQTLFGMQSGLVQGIGTGIIVSEDGYILTNSHVISDGNAEQITVDLYDGTEYSGKVLWNDSSLDLAIVKIEASNLSAAELGDADEIHIGDYALAIGNPLGLNYERSVTSGIISGLNRAITTQDESTGKTNNMDGLIQTDAAINSGNSGGPLINSNGQVIGINTAKASSSEGLGFAIPINTATPIIKQIREKGTYEQTYIGIAGVDLSTITENYATDFNAKNGVYVMQIYTGSPAASAGLKEGDIITEIDGKAVDGMSSLKSRMINYTPGDEIELTVEREKSDQKIKLTLGSSADATSTLQSNRNNQSESPSIEGGNGGMGGYGSESDGGFGSFFGQ